jgi:hypothetical protein
MATKKPVEVPDGPVYFAIIEDESKPLNRDRICYLNHAPKTDPETGVHVSDRCEVITPSPEGMYVIPAIHEFRKEMFAHLLLRVDDDLRPIIGPYSGPDARNEALMAREKVRPLSDDEKGRRAIVELAQIKAAKEAEKEPKREPPTSTRTSGSKGKDKEE